MAGNSQDTPLGGGCGLIREDGFIRNNFDQARAICRCGDSKNDVVSGERRLKIGLREGTTGSVGAALNAEQIVDSAIRRSVGIQDKARFPNRAVRAKKRWDRVLRVVQRGHRDLRIHGGAASARCGKRMAGAASVAVIAGPQALAGLACNSSANGVKIGKAGCYEIEEGGLIGG